MVLNIDATAIAADLTSDGDTYDLPDGRTLRLRFEPDCDTSMDDFEDFYGRTAWPVRYPDYIHSRRPEGFDGNAERIDTNDGPMWWQPPKDVKRSDPGFVQLRSIVRDLLNWGWQGIVLELLGPDADFYGHRPVLDVASLWGVETMVDREYLRTLVADLVGEVCL